MLSNPVRSAVEGVPYSTFELLDTSVPIEDFVFRPADDGETSIDWAANEFFHEQRLVAQGIRRTMNFRAHGDNQELRDQKASLRGSLGRQAALGQRQSKSAIAALKALEVS
jgi:hypothetical protein